MKNNDKNVDSSSQALSKEIKHDSPKIQDPSITPPPLTPEELEKFADIAEQLKGNDSAAVTPTQGEIKGEITEKK